MNSSTTRLALSLVPRPFESLDSYLERLAWRHRCTLGDLLVRVGLTRSTSYEALPRAYWIELTQDQIARLSAATDVAPDRIEQMLLRRYDGTCFQLGRNDNGAARSWRTFATREWVYTTSSHACPLCLAASDNDRVVRPAWDIRWRLPWSFACTKHGILLADTCPRCNGRIRGGAGLRPQQTRRVLPAGSCRNGHRPAPDAARGPCGFPLAELADAATALDPDVLAAQEQIYAVLEGHSDDTTSFAGDLPLTIRYDWFSELRSLCALILASGEPSDLGPVDDIAAEAFAAYTEERARRVQLRQASRWPRGGTPRLRPYTAVPQSPALMAGVATLAITILNSSMFERRDRIRPLLIKLGEHQRRAAFHLHRNLRLSEPLARDIRASRPAHIPSELDRLRQRPRQDHQFTVAHLPQLVDHDIFERHFRALLPGAKTDFARRFCSMALSRYRHGHTWEEAAAALDLPPRRATGLAYEISGRLTTAGTQSRFVDALAAAAVDIDSRPLTNYAERRRLLANLTHIEEPHWSQICRAAHVPHGRASGPRFAAAWLWCEVTAGDYRLAPALADAVSGDPWITRYTRWVKRPERVTRLAPSLTEYGLRLLDDRAAQDARRHGT